MRQAMALVRVTLREIRQTRAALQMGRGHLADAVGAMEHVINLGVKPAGSDEVLEILRGAKADFELSAVKLGQAMALVDRIIGE